MRTLFLFSLAVLATSCQGLGADSIYPGLACPRATGTWATNAWLTASDGTCPKAKAHSFDHFSFDERGAFESPAAALIPCVTRQSGCALEIECVAGAAHATFEGTLKEDGSLLTGVAKATSPEDGCRSVEYQVEGVR